MTDSKKPLELLAEAKAIAYAFKSGAITYEQGKARSESILNIYNELARVRAKKNRRVWYDLTWTRLASLV